MMIDPIESPEFIAQWYACKQHGGYEDYMQQSLRHYLPGKSRPQATFTNKDLLVLG